MGLTPEQFRQLQRNLENADARTVSRRSSEEDASRPRNPNGAERPQFQKHKGDTQHPEEGREEMPDLPTHPQGEADSRNQKGRSHLDGRLHCLFRVSIVVRFSDRRPRDINGAASTLLDVIRDAARDFASRGPKEAQWAADVIPFDDSFLIVPDLQVYAVQCAKGEEGATVVIESVTAEEVSAAVTLILNKNAPN